MSATPPILAQTPVRTRRPDLLAPPAERLPLNRRSLLLGLLGVVLVSALTPYNDHALANTYLIATYLPIGLLLFLLTLILLVNAPLRRFRPRASLSSGELAVIAAMMMVACAVPGSGLMRYLPASLVAPWYHAGGNGQYQHLLQSLHLPDWLFPDFQSKDALGRANDPVVRDYWWRAASDSPTFLGHLRAVPWHAWLRPALTWGLFLSFFWGAILCLAAIVRRQWVENERLAFPLAQIYLSLIEEPAPGRSLNALLLSRLFWLAFAVVFLIHGLNALALYDPAHFPRLPLGYDFQGLLSLPPWSYTSYGFRQASIYFSIIGITFFLQSNVAFSLFFFYLLFNAAKMFYGSWGADVTVPMQTDQLFGSLLVFVASLLWTGRSHWALVARHMLSRPRPGDAPSRYLPHAAAGWGLVLCTAGMAGWLLAAGASVAGAIVLVAIMLILFLAIARVVAETGMVFVQVPVPYNRPFVFAANELPGPLAMPTTLRSFFFSNWFYTFLGHDARETLPVFATHALRVADDALPERDRSRRRGVAFFAALAVSLLVAYLVSGASMLYTEYTYAATLDRAQTAPINEWAMVRADRWHTLDPSVAYQLRGGPIENHSRWGHFTFGAALTALLAVLRLRYVWWPLHPVGFLLGYSYPMEMLWLSVLVGWIAKLLIVRFGGAGLYKSARPAFIGLILGEFGAAAFWLVVSLVLNFTGHEYRAVNLLPI